jgi:multimeric flavodoxin WrbA
MQLTSYDGIIFGFPTRYGMMCAQMKAFFDGTGGLWGKGMSRQAMASPCSSSICKCKRNSPCFMFAIPYLSFYVHPHILASTNMSGVASSQVFYCISKALEPS